MSVECVKSIVNDSIVFVSFSRDLVLEDYGEREHRY
jgi:hypothetical protein